MPNIKNLVFRKENNGEKNMLISFNLIFLIVTYANEIIKRIAYEFVKLFSLFLNRFFFHYFCRERFFLKFCFFPARIIIIFMIIY